MVKYLKKCSFCHSTSLYKTSEWSRDEQLYSTAGQPVCKGCYDTMNIFEFLKYGLGLPLSHEHHGNLKGKELVQLAATMLRTAKTQFSNNLPKMSKEEGVEIMNIVLGAMLETESIPGFEFPKSVSESLIDWFKAAGIWKSNYNSKSCRKSGTNVNAENS